MCKTEVAFIVVKWRRCLRSLSGRGGRVGRAGVGWGGSRQVLVGPALSVFGMGKGAVIMASDNGIDPICKLSHRGEGIWVQSRSTASSDEGVNALDKVVTD